MKCEKCGCEEFEYVEGKKNSVTKTKLKFSLIMAALIVIGIAVKVYYISAIGILLVFFIKPILSFAEKMQQTRTYTKAICKNCQYIKYLE